MVEHEFNRHTYSPSTKSLIKYEKSFTSNKHKNIACVNSENREKAHWCQLKRIASVLSRLKIQRKIFFKIERNFADKIGKCTR